MPTQSVVQIFSVNNDGQVGAALGSGSLVHPRVVLAHRSAAIPTTGGDSPAGRLQVHIANGGAVDVVDVATVTAFPHPTGDPVVTLDLGRPSTAAFDALPGLAGVTDASSLLTVAARHLDAIHGGATQGGHPGVGDEAVVSLDPEDWRDGDPMGLFCRWLHVGCPNTVDD